MAYVGTTSTAPNPPRMLVGGQGSTEASPTSTSVATGKNLWFYNSTNTKASLEGVGFFSDGNELGMHTGDVLIAPTYTTQSATGHILIIGMLFSSNTTAGYNLSTDANISSTFG